MSQACPVCGGPLPAAAPVGRPRRYCSPACRARAYRRRRDDGDPAAPARPAGSGHRVATSAVDVCRWSIAAAAPPDDLIAVAVDLADAHGLDALTLWSLARRAARPVTAVRRQVGSRTRLVELMVGRVLSTPHPSVDGLRDALHGLARFEWDRYRAHPWLVTVLASTRPPLTEATLDLVDRHLRVLTDAGRAPDEAWADYLTLSAYLQGMAQLLVSEAQTTPYGTWRSGAVRQLTRRGLPGRYPWLPVSSRPSRPDVDRWFDDGLRRVLDGIAGGDDR